MLSVVSSSTKAPARSFSAPAASVKKTPLNQWHRDNNGKMIEFCGWDMPVLYEREDLGVLKEHMWCRQSCCLFDVSHMGQLRIVGKDRVKFLERVMVADVQELPRGMAKLSSLPNPDGGLIDDCMIANVAENYHHLVVNAACYAKDFAHMSAELEKFKQENPGAECSLLTYFDKALIAIQGPKAVDCVTRLLPSGKDLKDVKFMFGRYDTLKGVDCYIQRSGYTGEDGFEIQVPEARAAEIADAFVSMPECKPCGLGARDSLRLEAGLCLYGNDIDATTTPAEAQLMWTITKRRKAEGGFIGYEPMMKQIADNQVNRKRVGVLIDGPVARPHCTIHNDDGEQIGLITSGSMSPVLNKPIAMAYVSSKYSKNETPVQVAIRGKKYPAKIAKMPFVPNTFYKN